MFFLSYFVFCSRVFFYVFCLFVHHSEYFLVWTDSSLQTSCCFLLVVRAISSYFLYKGRQQRKSENLEVEFVLLLHSSTPETRSPTIIDKNYVHFHFHLWYFSCSNQSKNGYLLSFVIFLTINIRVKMDGLNLAKELRVFNKSYPTKAPPAEGEAAVRKIRLLLFLLCLIKNYPRSQQTRPTKSFFNKWWVYGQYWPTGNDRN